MWNHRTASPGRYELLKEYARGNRKNMTLAESFLWQNLRNNALDHKFLRQHVIGDYIVDFACLQKMLVIEVDGEYHSTDEQKALDDLRIEYLNKIGFSVIRFTNEQVVNHIDDVLAHIEELIYE